MLTSMIARRLEASTETLRLWGRQAKIDEDVRPAGLTTDEREELRRLLREVELPRQEREILVDAQSFFARDIRQTRPCHAA